MIQKIMRDEAFLKVPSTVATADDLQVAQDLLDTLRANAGGCVGLAANMIGVQKCIIVVENDGEPLVLINPEMIKCAGRYEAEEGCLSLVGTRKTKRYETIKLRYQNMDMQTRIKTFKGWTAQIIQHEMDHCQGIII